VLTDAEYFQGSLEDLQDVRASVAIPVLRKEFILDRIQLLEARVGGADAVLLIAECLPGDSLKLLYRQAKELGLGVLVELHDASELSRVVDCGATVIGVNNRDLRTFETNLHHTLDLMPKFPSNVTVVSESGIKTKAQLDLLAAAGVKAVLVGESLIRQPDPGAALHKLLHG
jgi:indole-3-glycerol phosphate synthase